MISVCPIQFIETAQTCQNPTLLTTGIGWNVKTHFNWFDKMVDITKFKAKPPSMLGCKMQNLRKTQESVWINKTLSKVRLDSDTIFGCVYSMICNVKQALLKDPFAKGARYKVFSTIPIFYAVIK